MPVHQAIADVKTICQQRGLRLTPIRQQVLELILAADGPVKAYDLLERLTSASKDQRRSAPPTVYRALDFLLENHFIHRLETMNAFVSCVHPEKSHSGEFLICEQCDMVIELSTKILSNEVREAAEAHQFQAHKQVVEVYGTCRTCQQA